MASQPGFVSSASDGSTFNSADCDSGAGDMFGDSLSLNELRKAYPELYQFMSQSDSNFENSGLLESKSELDWLKNNKCHLEQEREPDRDVTRLFSDSDSASSLLAIRKAMSSIFECLNTVHVQKTSTLRLEIRDLCCRLQSLQTSRDVDQREIYRLQRENDRYRCELSQQASRYEDRITELHSVLAELKRKATELQATYSSSFRDNGTVDIGDLVEASDSEPGDREVVVSTELSAFSISRSCVPPQALDSGVAHLSQFIVGEEPWMSTSLQTIETIQSENAAISATGSGSLQENRAHGKPVMGLIQHNQTRNLRTSSYCHLRESNSNSNCPRRNKPTPAGQLTQPASGLLLQQQGGLPKPPHSADAMQQSNSSIQLNNASSLTQTCGSGDSSLEPDETEPLWVRQCMNHCLAGKATGAFPGSFLSTAPSTTAHLLLAGLAGSAPYSRLSEVARSALLACEERDAVHARHVAELAAVDAALLNARSANDQMRLRLGQMEASWGAVTRSAELADLAIETSGVLVHLYSSELALLLHRRSQSEGNSNVSKSHHLRNSSRISHSGSAFNCSFTSSSSSSSLSSDEDGVPQMHSKSSAPVKSVALSALRRSRTAMSHQPSCPVVPSECESNIYALYAANGKVPDETSNIHMPTWIPPHVTCNGPACLRLLGMQRYQAEMTALHLFTRLTSTWKNRIKPESLISTVPDDFNPSAVNGNRSNTTGTESGLGVDSVGSSSGSGFVHGMYTNTWYVSGKSETPMGQSLKPIGGWLTLDSGSGSCGIHEHASSPLIVVAPDTQTLSSLSSTSISSAAVVAIGAASVVQCDNAGWNRTKELNLRQILDQIIWERMLLRNSIAVAFNDAMATGSELPNHDQLNQMSSETAVTNRLNALFLVDTATLLQEFGAVNEDRVKLKVHNYIMEKELRAIQLNLQGHCLSESTLRSQVNALQIDRNLQLPKSPDRVCQNNLSDRIESLHTAFESLRKGIELHQARNEDLVNDLKQANAALITAFEKAKSKYLARIRKLEDQLPCPSSAPRIILPNYITASLNTQVPMVPAHKSSLKDHPPSSPSDVYEVIQETSALPTPTLPPNPTLPAGRLRSTPNQRHIVASSSIHIDRSTSDFPATSYVPVPNTNPDANHTMPVNRAPTKTR